MSIPNDFPHFRVPGHEKEMESLRALFWLHYPRARPGATLWDEWQTGPGLWPATQNEGRSDQMREYWRWALSNRLVDPDGYVATHQHPSIAHPQGWPFPFWNQGQGSFGWHFSFKDTVDPPWRPNDLSATEGWKLGGAKDEGIGEDGWNLKLTAAGASIQTPARDIDTFQSPFIQIRWSASGLGNAQPYIEWISKDALEFGPDRRVYFDPVESEKIAYTAILMYKHPKWQGEITGLRVNFGNSTPGALATIQALFTQYDTRHNVNSQAYVRGCAAYFHWTRDIGFLQANINRMRAALRYVMTEHHALERRAVLTDWVGHDGRPGLKLGPDGSKTILYGRGIGNNYWDLLPFGGLDAYATIWYYDALLQMAQVEREIASHPEWNIPKGTDQFEPDALEKHAAEVKAEGNRLFWNPKTGRFAACIDVDGEMHDYGFTFLNFEAVYYDFATPEHARSIMSWISGERIVPGDTSQGPDIYHWRFAPRSTTKRNIEWYVWAWSAPETLLWGGQVQDGGAVLGFSYHDLMARLATRGPDNAWKRLQEIIRWFDEVQAAGGYRKYYDGTREGTLQGGGTAGGLGMDREFVESVLVPQVMLDGFLGFAPTADGFRIAPRLPSDWPELKIDHIRFHDLTLSIRAAHDTIEVLKEGGADGPCFVHLPKGEWKLSIIGPDGKAGPASPPKKREIDGAVQVDWQNGVGARFERKPQPANRPAGR